MFSEVVAVIEVIWPFVGILVIVWVVKSWLSDLLEKWEKIASTLLIALCVLVGILCAGVVASRFVAKELAATKKETIAQIHEAHKAAIDSMTAIAGRFTHLHLTTRDSLRLQIAKVDSCIDGHFCSLNKRLDKMPGIGSPSALEKSKQ